MDSKEHIRDLVQKIAIDGDQKAANQLFNIFYTPLIYYAMFYVKRHDAAEDVVSEVFYKVFRKPKKVLDIHDFTFYLYKSVKHQSLTYIKRNLSQIIEADKNELSTNSVFMELRNPESELITSELLTKIKLIINDFPPRRKLIYNMIAMEGMSYKEVASLLSISSKTVDNQLASAVKSLRVNLQNHL